MLYQISLNTNDTILFAVLSLSIIFVALIFAKEKKDERTRA